jgi:hypothetical protein
MCDCVIPRTCHPHIPSRSLCPRIPRQGRAASCARRETRAAVGTLKARPSARFVDEHIQRGAAVGTLRTISTRRGPPAVYAALLQHARSLGHAPALLG